MINKVRITGFGGQGVITAGYILGHAAAIHDDMQSVFTQSYGPEARGSACSACIILSDQPILRPFFKTQDIMVALSQEGFDIYLEKTKKGGLVLIDEDLVDTSKVPAKLKKAFDWRTIPATRLAEKEFDKRIVTNIIMLGFLTSSSKVVTKEAMLDAVVKITPKGTTKLNTDAMLFGYDYNPKEKKAPVA
jgi:2-oxoglutarate ferredoxin oxidoreductase subunit gamma